MGLCLDHAWPIYELSTQRIPILTIFSAILLTAILITYRHPLGFCMGSFFLVLAPTSSFVPILDLCYEHRMYVPLSAILLPSVCVTIWVSNRLTKSTAPAVALLIAAIVTLTIFSALRCQDYRSRTSIWQDVIRKAPHNPRGHMNFAEASYFVDKDFEAAIASYKNCLSQLENPKHRIPPVVDPQELFNNLSKVQNNYGILLMREKRLELAKAQFEAAIENGPLNAQAHTSMGNYYLASGDQNTAKEWYHKALELDPTLKAAKTNLARLD